MPPIRSFGQKRSGSDEVLFAVRYQNGHTAHIHVQRKTAEHGEGVVMDIALDRQKHGLLPAGTIVSVKRVR